MVSRMVSQAFRVVVNHPRGKTTTTFIDMSFPWRILLVPRPGLIYWNYLLIKHIAMEKNSYIQGKSVNICKHMIHICKHHLETDHVHPFYKANCQKHQRLRIFNRQLWGQQTCYPFNISTEAVEVSVKCHNDFVRKCWENPMSHCHPIDHHYPS